MHTCNSSTAGRNWNISVDAHWALQWELHCSSCSSKLLVWKDRHAKQERGQQKCRLSFSLNTLIILLSVLHTCLSVPWIPTSSLSFLAFYVQTTSSPMHYRVTFYWPDCCPCYRQKIFALTFLGSLACAQMPTHSELYLVYHSLQSRSCHFGHAFSPITWPQCGHVM